MTSSPAPAVLTVSQLNGSVRELLEFNYGRVWLRGEISNLSAPSSGHLYFTLKDDEAQVRAAMFKGARTTSRLQQPPRHGQQVLVRARVSLYAPRGDYQLIVEHLEDAGKGALQQAFEMLKARLAAEGLFSAERKRTLPASPRGIVVVTSPSGAAIRDILQVLRRRAPGIPVQICPVPVQGNEAPPAIVAALTMLRDLHENDFRDADGRSVSPFDVAIIARGGGSLEDLWAFNEEAVVRALADLPVPVVSGIGHEIDFTIADFVVDVRAPTPSAAAELASPDWQQWAEKARQGQVRLQRGMVRQLQQRQEQLQQLRRRLRSPARQLQDRRQQLDDLEVRLGRAMQRQLLLSRQQHAVLRQRLQTGHPGRRLTELGPRLRQLHERLQRLMQRQLEQHRFRFQSLVLRAEAVSPLAVMTRGYAIVTTGDGQLLRSSAETAPGRDITIRLQDGRLEATVTACLPANLT